MERITSKAITRAVHDFLWAINKPTATADRDGFAIDSYAPGDGWTRYRLVWREAKTGAEYSIGGTTAYMNAREFVAALRFATAIQYLDK